MPLSTVGLPHAHAALGPVPQMLHTVLVAATPELRCVVLTGEDLPDGRKADAVYDSFTITLAMLLEDLGLAKRGEAAARVRSGHFSRDGELPLNTFGGSLGTGRPSAWRRRLRASRGSARTA